MPESNKDAIRGTGNRLVPKPIITADEIDNLGFNTGPADPYVIRKPLKHRDPPALDRPPMPSRPMLGFEKVPDDPRLLNRATGDANRFPTLQATPGRRLNEARADLRPVKTDPKLLDSIPYEGEVLTHTPGDLDFSTVYAVVVSGDFPNPCGHALMFVPKTHAISSKDGSYFQVAGAYTFPRIMNNAGYARYLRTTGKSEITRYAVTLPRPNDAVNHLVSLMQKKWVWGVLPHNCAAFVEEVVRAGGSSAGLYSNCPRAERFSP